MTRTFSGRDFATIIAMLCFVVVLRANPAEASVQIDESEIEATAYDGDSSYEVSDPPFTGTTIPTSSAPLGVSALGVATSNNVINWATSGGQSILSLAMNHERAGSTFSNVYAQTASTIRFTVNANATYELSGTYQVTDVGAAESGYVELRGYLNDITASDLLFSNYQNSYSTTNELFTLGEEGGDDVQFGNFLYGNLTGPLLSGHTYEWISFASFGSLGASPGASAVGNVSLKIVDTVNGGSAVPEAASVLIWSLLGLTVAGAAWRRPRGNLAIEP